MSISLGTETVIVERLVTLRSVRIEGLDTPSGKTMNIDYVYNGELKTKTIGGQEWNEFYLVKWVDARPIFNQTELRELIQRDIELEEAEKQFTNEIVENAEPNQEI